MNHNICLVRPVLEMKEEALLPIGKSILQRVSTLFAEASFLIRRKAMRNGWIP